MEKEKVDPLLNKGYITPALLIAATSSVTVVFRDVILTALFNCFVTVEGRGAGVFRGQDRVVVCREIWGVCREIWEVCREIWEVLY